MQQRRRNITLRKKTLKDIMRIYGAGFGLAVIILVLAYQFVEPAPPRTITLATASKDGAYYRYAQRYRELFAKEEIDLQIIETSGSSENIELLAEKKVEVAFLQGGIGSSEEYDQLQGLASLYFEPLWIFVRNDSNISKLTDFEGKSVAVGPEGSGTRAIARQLFDDNNMINKQRVVLNQESGEKAVAPLLTGEIDGLMMVTRIDSPIISRLAAHPELKLLSLARAESYTRLHHYLSHLEVPEGLLDMENNIPSAPVQFIAPAATLVATDELHPALADLFMQILTKVHKTGSLLSTTADSPSANFLDFPLNKEAERFFQHGPPFFQRFLPFWAASLVDRLKFMVLPLLALVLPLTKILPPTYRWRVRSRIYRWYDELHELDIFVRDNLTKDNLNQAIAALEEIEQEIRHVEVPLSYGEELYNLRLHVDLLRQQFTREVDLQGD